MRHASMTALALVLGLAAAPAVAQSDKPSEPKASAAVTGCIQAGAQVSAEAFDALDDNGDGFVAQQEYVEKCGKASAAADGDDAAKAHFASLDANRDQKLTQDEFKSPAVKRSGAATGAAAGAVAGSSASSPTQSAQAPAAPSTTPPSTTPPAANRSMSADTPSTSGAPSTTSGAATPKGAQALAGVQAEEVIGMDVVNAKGDEIGEVKDLVLDRQQVAHAVVSVGGFLGIGAKDIAVPFEQLRVGAENVILMSETSESELKQMPEYKKDQYSPVQREGARKAAPATQPKQ